MANDDLISRQTAIDYFVTNVGFHDEDGYPIEDTDELRKIWTDYFDGIPSAQRRGRWEHLGGDEWCCTACAHVITTEGSWERPWQKYCEECGARMEVE